MKLDLTRAELAEWAAALRARGWNNAAIAEELGIRRSYTSALINDPTGARDRARKDSYRQPCPGVDGPCGRLMTGANGRKGSSRFCPDCAQRRSRYWTRGRLIDFLRAAAVVLGRNPTMLDLIVYSSPSLRSRLTEQRVWEAEAGNDALVAAGLRIPKSPSGQLAREFPSQSRRPGGRSWDLALRAAGLGQGRSGGAPEHRVRRAPPERPEPPPSDKPIPARTTSPLTTVTVLDPSRRQLPIRGKFFCPSCGESTSRLDAYTGWCALCTLEHSIREAAS